MAIFIVFILGKGLSSSLKYLSMISTVFQVDASVVLQTGLRTSTSVRAPVVLQTGAAGTMLQVPEQISKSGQSSLVILQTRLVVALSEVSCSDFQAQIKKFRAVAESLVLLQEEVVCLRYVWVLSKRPIVDLVPGLFCL